MPKKYEEIQTEIQNAKFQNNKPNFPPKSQTETQTKKIPPITETNLYYYSALRYYSAEQQIPTRNTTIGERQTENAFVSPL